MTLFVDLGQVFGAGFMLGMMVGMLIVAFIKVGK